MRQISQGQNSPGCQQNEMDSQNDMNKVLQETDDKIDNSVPSKMLGFDTPAKPASKDCKNDLKVSDLTAAMERVKVTVEASEAEPDYAHQLENKMAELGINRASLPTREENEEEEEEEEITPRNPEIKEPVSYGPPGVSCMGADDYGHQYTQWDHPQQFQEPIRLQVPGSSNKRSADNMVQPTKGFRNAGQSSLVLPPVGGGNLSQNQPPDWSTLLPFDHEQDARSDSFDKTLGQWLGTGARDPQVSAPAPEVPANAVNGTPNFALPPSPYGGSTGSNGSPGMPQTQLSCDIIMPSPPSVQYPTPPPSVEQPQGSPMSVMSVGSPQSVMSVQMDPPVTSMLLAVPSPGGSTYTQQMTQVTEVATQVTGDSTLFQQPMPGFDDLMKKWDWDDVDSLIENDKIQNAPEPNIVPSNIRNVPNNRGNVPNNMGNVPSNIRNVPNNMGNVPNNMGNVPSNIRNVPNNMGNVPCNIGNVPSNIGNVPNNIGNVASNISNVPSNIGNVPNNISNVPNNINSVPRNINNIPTYNNNLNTGMFGSQPAVQHNSNMPYAAPNIPVPNNKMLPNNNVTRFTAEPGNHGNRNHGDANTQQPAAAATKRRTAGDRTKKTTKNAPAHTVAAEPVVTMVTAVPGLTPGSVAVTVLPPGGQLVDASKMPAGVRNRYEQYTPIAPATTMYTYVLPPAPATEARVPGPTPPRPQQQPQTRRVDAPPPPHTTASRQASDAIEQQTRTSLAKSERAIAELKRNQLLHHDSDGDTILHIAIAKKQEYIVTAFLQRCQREGLTPEVINVTNNLGQTPIYLATVTNQPAVIKQLINNGGNVNIQAHTVSESSEKHYKGPLHLAAKGGMAFYQCLEAIVAALNVQLDMADYDGLTALHCAVKVHGQRDVKADCNINSQPIIKLLVSRGALMNPHDGKSGKTPFMYAVEKRDLEFLLFLCELAPPDKLRDMLNAHTFDGNTCLHTAAGLQKTPRFDCQKQQALIRHLMCRGADTTIKNSAKQMPKDCVTDKRNKQAIQDVLRGIQKK